VSERNIDNLARLNLGMSKAQVLRIMPNPFEYETLQLFDEKFDVLFYVTNPTVLGQTRMVPFNLTPLIFKNKILVAVGYGYYNYLKDKIVESKKEAPKVEAEISMSCVKKQEPEAELADPPPPTTPSPSPSKKKDIQINEEDEQMIQDEDDQNFNFW